MKFIANNQITATCLCLLGCVGLLHFRNAVGQGDDWRVSEEKRAAIEQEKELAKTRAEAAAELEKYQINSQADVDAEKAKAQKRAAESYTKNQIAPPTHDIRLSGYIYAPGRPPTVPSWNIVDSRKHPVKVYDQNMFCVGAVSNGRFMFRDQNQSTCQ